MVEVEVVVDTVNVDGEGDDDDPVDINAKLGKQLTAETV